jgi:hypothetical protein
LYFSALLKYKESFIEFDENWNINKISFTKDLLKLDFSVCYFVDYLNYSRLQLKPAHGVLSGKQISYTQKTKLYMYCSNIAIENKDGTLGIVKSKLSSENERKIMNALSYKHKLKKWKEMKNE